MTFSLTWLPDVLKAAGLKVALVPGWENRGRGDVGEVRGVLCHHTAGGRDGNMPSLKTLIDGRPDLPGPLSQLGLGRDGTFYVIAAGRCNHAGPGNWQGIKAGNSSFIGIEGENTGSTKDFPWPAVQMDAYHRGVAAILRKVGKNADFCAGHREYALPTGRKSDPLFDMIAFRTSVAAFLNGTAPPPVLIPPVEPTGPRRPTLRRGTQGDSVRTLQTLLGVQATGNFGPQTEAAVREFQRSREMVPDGIVGPKTWAALDAPPPPPIAPPPPVVVPVTVSPLPGSLAAAHQTLAGVTASVAVADWSATLAAAVQRALAELFLLNPFDDVDGKTGARTRQAWALFRAAAGLPGGEAIDPAAAQRLITESTSPAGFIGAVAVQLEPAFEFRRNRRTANREASAAAIIAAAKRRKLTNAQIAYILATAEHESDRFATLEEYATGDAYEGRASLGNNRPGDGRRYKGRGYVQLTGRRNYTNYAASSGIRLADLPTILQNWPELSVWVLVDGMVSGAYTGRRLDEFVNKHRQDFRQARRVVNGLDQADKIAAQAEAWLAKLP